MVHRVEISLKSSAGLQNRIWAAEFANILREIMTMIRTLLTATASVVAAASAFADGHFMPAVIFDMGGKFDKSFNEAAYNGAEAFKAETGVEYLEFEITDPSQRESVLREFAELGANPIVVMGFAQADAMGAVAPEFPDTQFGIVDVSWLGGDNLRQYYFDEHKGSYLVGVAAAMASETGTVSFVGGMDIPLIRDSLVVTKWA